MTMVAGHDADEALISAARSMFQQNRQRSERVCFYRTPQRRPDGSPHHQAGWIGWGDTQDSVKLGKIMRGYIPLEQYGYIRTKRRDDDADGPYEVYGPWGVIISQASGVLEFPLDQILTFHWYDANRLRMSLNGQIPPTLRVKDGMVLWPQLRGVELRIFACPECGDWRTLEAVQLARHLRIWHDYDRADIIAFGEQYGVDFVMDINRGGRVLKKYAFEDEPFVGEAADEDSEDIGFNLEVARPQRGPGRPRKQPPQEV